MGAGMGAGESGLAVRPLATALRGTALPRGAIHCTTFLLADCARLIGPRKTAAHWAAAAGVKERMAKYWLSGQRPVSASGRLAILRMLQS